MKRKANGGMRGEGIFSQRQSRHRATACLEGGSGTSGDCVFCVCVCVCVFENHFNLHTCAHCMMACVYR